MQKERLLKFFEVISVSEQTKNYLDSILPDIAQGNHLNINDLDQAIDIGEILCKMADAAERFFTDDELDALIVFYSSPIGQGILPKMPVFLENLAIYGMNFIGQKLHEFFARKDASPDDTGKSGAPAPN